MFTCFGQRNQNKSSFGLVKQDSYVACAKRDKISRYTDIERKNKVERTRACAQVIRCGAILAIALLITARLYGAREAHIGGPLQILTRTNWNEQR